MLCLNLNQGEYLTIGDKVVVQLDRISGDRCKLVIQAPKQVTVLRGGGAGADGRKAARLRI